MTHTLDEYTSENITRDARFMHNEHSKLLTEDEYDIASDAATELLARVGYESDQERDDFGDFVSNLSQTLVVVLMMRLPKLRDAILSGKLEWVD
jgi:hypothetical protein